MLLGRMAWRAVAAGAAVTSLALASAAGPATAAAGTGSKHDPVIPVSSAAWGRERRPVTAYVVNYLSGTVTPIRTAVNKAGTAIPVENGPQAIAITP